MTVRVGRVSLPSWLVNTVLVLAGGVVIGWVSSVNLGFAQNTTVDTRQTVQIETNTKRLDELAPVLQTLSDNVHELNGRLTAEREARKDGDKQTR